MAVAGRVSKLNRYQITRQSYVTAIIFDNKFVVYLPNSGLITIGIIIIGNSGSLSIDIYITASAILIPCTFGF